MDTKQINRADDEGVINLWVKSYDLYNRLSCNPNHLTVVDARADYAARIADDRTTFAQFGAHTVEGPIVLGEYRKT